MLYRDALTITSGSAATSAQTKPLPSRRRDETVKSLINVHKDSIWIEPDEWEPDCHLVSFSFDSLAAGSFTIFYFAKEEQYCGFSQVYPNMDRPVKVPFRQGFGQRFIQPPRSGTDLGFFEYNELSRPLHGNVFPLVLYAESYCEPISPSTASKCTQVTQAVIEKVDDGPFGFQVKVKRQLLWVNGECYDQEFFGVGSSPEAEIGTNISDIECVICMFNARDTALLPCRHMLRGQMQKKARQLNKEINT
uniref:RING-type E3 ubiquitin transferase n=1 Tax=Ananas comosus var. bracteatus TaxID=296719 RepID=A0A6V7PFX0_ANACO|nr:unnamed protein product [Ananas comosus var. bracteatus]